ncbi:MAG: MBL fold metallo-hydrolase [Oscillospiraceae bacterium]|nr:MBL fold metallo-hydrolase [Oscillospiraceae bacterium]
MRPDITVNIQSSIRIAGAGLVIRFDPFRITGEPHDADIIFITHAHYDHFSPDDIRKVSKPGTVIAAPKSMEKQLAKEGMTDTVLFAPGESGTVQGIPAEAIHAYNSFKPFHPKSAGFLGYVITVDGQRIYAAGDTDAVREARAVSCDIALVPVGGTFTMNAKEAAALVNAMQPKIAVPIHYGAVAGDPMDGEKFRQLVAPGIEVQLLLS